MRYINYDGAVHDTIIRELKTYTHGVDPNTVFDVEGIAAETIFECDDLYEFAEPEQGFWAVVEAHRR